MSITFVKADKYNFFKYIFGENNLIHQDIENINLGDCTLFYIEGAPISQYALTLFQQSTDLNDMNTIKVNVADDLNNWTFEDFESEDFFKILEENGIDFEKYIPLPMIVENDSRTIISNNFYLFHEFTQAIDEAEKNTIQWIINHLLKPIYIAGYTSNQREYELHFDIVFDALRILNQHFSKNRFLLNSGLNISDLLLYTILVRFDEVYFTVFKLNNYLIREYPYLSKYVLDLHQNKDVGRFTKFNSIKRHYYHNWSPFEFEEGDANAPSQPFRQLPKSPDPQFWDLKHYRNEFV